ncbi:MAG TPA: purine-nucleoside phosphorylase [Saprospiraceae bacterium]|nr:purine-nucleoside phosphorylase [Saprospiraceae bacterium]HMX85241.1 purine-nucleoside phosphorylase [Saprospiraceae bacterium]HMZ72286.1 purine-nucleoside phosphorylase [Saprospiraceae bacterium]HND15246.1 purine-nucleoside phosphorylase [Saprospiraceae bacterium]HNE47543.1 purine-nucleoside phosphorylase [Saprospiraceae bacterium]
MNDRMFDQIKEAADYIVTHLNVKPKIGMVLGTGLSNIASEIEDEVIIRYAAIPWFSHSTVASHKGEMVFGRLGEKDVVILAGRFHYYEGYTMQQVTFPVRVLKELGVETILISNAAGSVNAAYEAGDIVFLKDHINLMPENPLRGPNDERLGLRFPDMSDAYDKNLIEKAVEIANKNNIRCHQGVYVALQGPNLETPSEYNFINVIGGDLVGMSTVPEVLVARHCGMRVFGVSVVSNKCFPLSAIKETTHESVIAVANETEPKLAKIFKEIIQFID